MMNHRKNLTVDGIHYYLVGNCYVPTAPGFVPDRRTDDYGMLHLKYLQMAHPDDAAELLLSGRGRQYLLRIDQLVKQFIKEREDMAPIPQLSDPAFEEKYIRHYIMSCNATCKAETKFVCPVCTVTFWPTSRSLMVAPSTRDPRLFPTMKSVFPKLLLKSGWICIRSRRLL